MHLRAAKVCAIAVLLVVGGLGGSGLGVGTAWAAPKKSPASDNNILGMIRRGFDGVEKKPALFDGRVVPATANIREAHVLLSKLQHGIEVFEGNWQNLSDEAQATPEFKAAQAKYNELKPYFVAFGPALELREKQNAQAEADARAKEQAARDAQEAEYQRKKAADIDQQRRRDDVCGGFWAKLGDREAGESVAGAIDSVPDNAKDVTDKKQLLEKGAAVCKAPEYANVAELRALCKDSPSFARRSGNVYPADVCEGTAHLDDTMRAGIAARVGREVAWNPAPSVEDLRFREGYIQTQEPFLFEMNLELSDANKKALVEKWGPLYAAAGLPFDESAFEPIKAYYDKYRASVEALAGEWTTPGQKCKGGIIAKVCNMAKKDVLAWHKKAKIIKVTTDDVVYVKGSEAELDGWVLYQLPGETYCQLRAWTVNEDGGNRHHLATRLNYVRVQQCK
jgi:hypothetical protein